MPSKPVYGKDVQLLFLWNAIYQQVACGTECSLSVETDVEEVTTKTNIPGEGAWERIVPVKNRWSGGIQGVEFLDKDVLKFVDIRQIQTSLTPIHIMFTEVDSSGTEYANWYGIGVITNTTNTAGANGFSTYDIAIRGDGILRADFDPTNLSEPVEMWLYYEATGNEGRSWVIPELQGYLISGRLHRDGMEVSASGTQRLGREAADTPQKGQFKWDSSAAKITISDEDPEPAAGERIDIPYTNAYSGCSLAINNFKVALNSNNHFLFTWQGTGLPENQLAFEYSTDYGVTTQVLPVTLDATNLDNATNETLDVAGSYIFTLTPICTNNQKGKPSYAYWKAAAGRIINNRTDGILITYLGYNYSSNQSITMPASDGETQDSLVTFDKSPVPGPIGLTVVLSGNALPALVVVKNKDGKVIGQGNTTNAQQSIVVVSVSPNLPNEFTVIIS